MTLFEKLWYLHKKHNCFGYEIGDGCACFIDKLTTGEWKIAKIDENDEDRFRKIIPENTSDSEFKNIIKDMIAA